MPIVTFALGPLETNCYLLHDTTQAVAVDVGGDPADMLDFLRERGLMLTHILITHQHFDHLYGVAALQQATGAQTLAPAADDCLRASSVGRGGQWGLPLVPDFAAEPLPLGEQRFGAFAMQVLETPGHTPGSVSLYVQEEKAVFTGDALFYRSVGRTDFPGGDAAQLIRSIRTGLFTLPEDTRVFPGHGPETRVGDERAGNPYCGDFAMPGAAGA